jgi:tetraacyldisaccharide 4'-kinase
MRQYLHNLITDRENGFGSCIIKAFLFCLSVIYGLTVRALVFFYRLNPRRINCRVISVGNITLGGTGKTSLVEFIARFLKERGHKVAILSRGYRRDSTDDGRRTTDETMGDEPRMLQAKLQGIPVIVDADRVRGANKAIKEFGTDTVILDDGLQQWRINKDLEIITIDSANPFGNGHLLPRGILREPLSGLKRADVFVLTKTNLGGDTGRLKAALNKINPRAAVIESAHKPLGFYDMAKPEELLPADILKGETAALFCGIGDPGSFEKLIAGLRIKIGLSFRFFDHHNYTEADLEKIIRESKHNNIDTIITTEKDAVRVPERRTTNDERRILVLRIALEIKENDEERFFNRLLTL